MDTCPGPRGRTSAPPGLQAQGAGGSRACGNPQRSADGHVRGQAPPPPPLRRRGQGQCALGPPRRKSGLRETPTGLQCALPHHRGESAQALRRAGRQAEGVLRVGFEVLHHKCRGRVEGPPHLGAGRGGGGVGGDREAETEREPGRQRDRDTEIVKETQKGQKRQMETQRQRHGRWRDAQSTSGQEQGEERHPGTKSVRPEGALPRPLPLPPAPRPPPVRCPPVPLCRGRPPGTGVRT